MERRIGGLEVRADGRRLSGTVMRYGDVSPSHRERFEPRAFTINDAVPFNLEHDTDRAIGWHPGGGLELRQDGNALTMVADLPPIPAADKALALVRSGVATGLSVEFNAIKETRANGIRVVESALLVGIGLVRDPAYEQSRVEARRRKPRRTWIRGGIEFGVAAHCDCIDGSCSTVSFRPEALRVLDSTIATVGRATESVGSVRGGTLRVRNTDKAFEFEIDAAAQDTAAGRQLADLNATGTPVYGRPIVDMDNAVFEDIDGVRTYTEAPVRALLLKPILGPEGNSKDWRPLVFGSETPEPPARRRSSLWRL